MKKSAPDTNGSGKSYWAMTDREQAEFEARHNFFIGYGQRMDFRPVRPGKAAVPRRKVRRVAA